MFKIINKLCSPAYVYLVISLVTITLMFLQNINDDSSYCVGNVSCKANNKMLIFTIKLIYVVFWTWVLQLICNSGWTSISWLLVLLPYFSMFLMIILFMFKSSESIPLLVHSSPI